jgi:hypothetical protein
MPQQWATALTLVILVPPFALVGFEIQNVSTSRGDSKTYEAGHNGLPATFGAPSASIGSYPDVSVAVSACWRICEAIVLGGNPRMRDRRVMADCCIAFGCRADRCDPWHTPRQVIPQGMARHYVELGRP